MIVRLWIPLIFSGKGYMIPEREERSYSGETLLDVCNGKDTQL